MKRAWKAKQAALVWFLGLGAVLFALPAWGDEGLTLDYARVTAPKEVADAPVQRSDLRVTVESKNPFAVKTAEAAGAAPRIAAGVWGTDSVEAKFVALLSDQPVPAAGDEDAGELAKKLSNPVANLISVPFQYNADFNAGVSGHAQRSYLNIQPVVPFELNKEWSLITRTIIPVVYQEELAPGQGTNWGLGDTSMSLFFTPAQHPGGWILAAGPVFLFPTGTDTALGGEKWGAGPTVLALRQESGWTYGILASHTWSFAGANDRSAINATFLQPFLSYQFPTATTLGVNLESTYDWTGRQWTVPVNVFASQVVKIGKMPVSFTLGGRYYVEGPTGGPEWGMRFVVTLLFPK